MAQNINLPEYSAALILSLGEGINPAIEVKIYIPKDKTESVPDHMLAITEIAHMISNDPNSIRKLASKAKQRLKTNKLNHDEILSIEE